MEQSKHAPTSKLQFAIGQLATGKTTNSKLANTQHTQATQCDQDTTKMHKSTTAASTYMRQQQKYTRLGTRIAHYPQSFL